MWSARLVVEPLDVEVATRFLLQRTGQDDAGAARDVAETLGGLPLALEQAAAYVTASGRDLASYAGLLRGRLVDLLREGRAEDHPEPVAGAWQLSLERVEAERPAAADLLRLCAFLAPDDIPAGVLAAGAKELPGGLPGALGDDIELDRTIATLLRYSLVGRRSDELRVHRLVQVVVRESIAAGEREAWLAAAIRLLRATFPPEAEEHPEQWPLCDRLLAHVWVVARLAGDGPVEARALGWVVNRAAMYLWVRGAARRARPVVESALAIRRRELGPDDPDTAASLNDLGIVLAEQEDLGAARSLYERALAIRERVLGPDHVDTAESHYNVGIALLGLGELAGARTHIERTLAIRRATMGPDHPQTAMTINSLGSVLRQQGDLAGARRQLETALRIQERTVGADHPRVAQSLDHLGWVLREQGDLDAARPLMERAHAIYERVLGPDHPYAARSLHSLALLTRDQGRPEAARPLLERAAATLDRTLGPYHRWTVESRRALAALGGG